MSQDHFSRYEIMPVVESDGMCEAFTSKKLAEAAYKHAVETSQNGGKDCRMFWTIYGRNASDGFAEAIADDNTPEGAANTLSKILGRHIAPSPDYLKAQSMIGAVPAYGQKRLHDQNKEFPEEIRLDGVTVISGNGNLGVIYNNIVGLNITDPDAYSQYIAYMNNEVFSEDLVAGKSVEFYVRNRLITQCVLGANSPERVTNALIQSSLAIPSSAGQTQGM